MTDDVQETNSGSRTPTTPPEAAEDDRARNDVINRVIAEQVCAEVLEKGKDIVVGLENGDVYKVKATSASKVTVRRSRLQKLCHWLLLALRHYDGESGKA
jgi:hypothetical protein